MYNIITVYVNTGPQECVCNWCGQLGGRRVGKGVIIITCANPVPGKFFLRHRDRGTFWGYFELYEAF